MDFFNFPFPFDEWPFVIIVVAIAFSLHEFAHAYAAYKFGDPTAKRQGRVTLNPMAHMDLLGTIFIFLAGFGWARPVPVKRSNFKHPRLMGIVVSIVGPLSNLLIAFVGMLLLAFISKYLGLQSASLGVYEAVTTFFQILIGLNIALFLFNLIPIPPLDGYRIIEDLVPNHIRARMAKIEHWAILLFLLIVFIPPLRNVTLVPLFSLSDDIYYGLVRIVQAIFGI